MFSFFLLRLSVCLQDQKRCVFFFYFIFDQVTKSDRVYVNAPEMQKEKNENIQLLSFNSNKAEDKSGEENKGLDTEEGEEESDKEEEILTPGDLMAFAWQISQGMVSRSSQTYGNHLKELY